MSTSNTASMPAAYLEAELAGLPEPVERYFRFALTPGQPLIESAAVEHVGQFCAGVNRAWHPFHSVERFEVRPCSFVWDAHIHLAPLVDLQVRDSYRGGEGATRGRLARFIPFLAQAGTAELAAASLQRYLAEAAWLPTALLPSQGVVWTARDEKSAVATVEDAGTSAALTFVFGERGEIVRVQGDRYRADGGRVVLTPWLAQHWEYAEIQGMQIPVQGSVYWKLPAADFCYWQGRVRNVSYRYRSRA